MRQKQQQVKTKQDRISITLPIELADKLRQLSKKHSISMSFLARKALEEKLNKMEKESEEKR